MNRTTVTSKKTEEGEAVLGPQTQTAKEEWPPLYVRRHAVQYIYIKFL